jgi:hypothetical protein
MEEFVARPFIEVPYRLPRQLLRSFGGNCIKIFGERARDMPRAMIKGSGHFITRIGLFIPTTN